MMMMMMMMIYSRTVLGTYLRWLANLNWLLFPHIDTIV